MRPGISSCVAPSTTLRTWEPHEVLCRAAGHLCDLGVDGDRLGFDPEVSAKPYGAERGFGRR